ncbi:hypothetical protein [Xanthomonas nasturtii]|uniref:hypothetical protein n=1 Tax=Xanthomonas nasturtii TaxID=1843581 RepID=UPI002B23DE9C|nr:hypothetical protein [Xanthomonas nasturtii]
MRSQTGLQKVTGVTAWRVGHAILIHKGWPTKRSEQSSDEEGWRAKNALIERRMICNLAAGPSLANDRGKRRKYGLVEQ